ncbi:MAG: hypothetical protein WC869_09800, partial [Phycisphaerae bacterium]
EVGVATVICAVGNLEESHQARDLAARFDGVYFLAGLHPHDAKAAAADYLAQLESLAGRFESLAGAQSWEELIWYPVMQ